MKDYLTKLALAQQLSEEELTKLFEALIGQGPDAASDAQIAAYLFYTSQQGSSVDELVSGATCLRQHSAKIPVPASLRPLLDTCGTGGSGLPTFNTSTAVAFVCAAAGQAVVKHGNRAATSKSGSADVLEALGVKLELSVEQLVQCLAETKFCFAFAPRHHPATARVARIRKELGIKTIFNFLGPLSNPAFAEYQVLGVSSEAMLESIARAVQRLGTRRALCLRGAEGLDEISLSEETVVWHVTVESLQKEVLSPEQFAFKRRPLAQLVVDSPQHSAQIMRSVFSGEQSAFSDLVLLNAGAGLYVAQRAATIAEGVALAREVVASGKALQALQNVIDFTQGV